MTDRPGKAPAKTVGILGGLGALAGAHFYRRLLELKGDTGDASQPRVVLVADPDVPSRIDHLGGRGPSPVPALQSLARTLHGAGATFLAVPSSTTHAYYDEIAAVVPIPVIHLPRTAMVAARAQGMTSLALMATTPTVTLGIYEAAARQAGVHLVYPDGETQAAIQRLVLRTKAGEDPQRLGEELARLRRRPWSGGADGVLLGCTELPVICPPSLRTPGLLDASDVLALACLSRLANDPVPS